MKKFIMSILMPIMIIMLTAFTVAGCSKVPAGHVGIKVYLLGSSKGVDVEELTPGRYWIGWNEELYLFPTYTVNYVWTKDSSTESIGDESISFQTSEGLSVNADVGITYHVDPSKTALLFQKYRRGVDEITDSYLRNMVRDALITIASRNKIEYVYGAGREDLMNQVENIVKEEVFPYGINVEKIYWIGDLRLPDAVVNALNDKISAIQRAEQRNNEIAEKKAEAQKAIEVARGNAESQVLEAAARAKAIEIEGEALRRNPEILKMRAVEKWDGVMPRFMGGQTPIPFIDLSKENTQ